MPRGHPLSGRELSDQVVGLGSLQRDRVQARRAIPPQQAGQQPLAEAAFRVVKNRPAAFAEAGRALTCVSVVRHVDKACAVVGSPASARHSRPSSRIAGGYTIRCRNGLIAAM